MRKQIAGYIRVSTAKQKNNGISLEMQKNVIIEHAMMLGLINSEKEITFYIDEGYSGNALERPRLKELIENVKNDMVESIFCYDLPRLSRNLFEWKMLLKLFSNHKITVKCIYDDIIMTAMCKDDIDDKEQIYAKVILKTMSKYN